jgi:hypothetical protein
MPPSQQRLAPGYRVGCKIYKWLVMKLKFAVGESMS